MPRPKAKVSSFSVNAPTNSSGRFRNPSSSPDTPVNVLPSGRPPEASMGTPSSKVRHRPETAAVHVRNPVMLRQPFVQECIVRPEEVEHTAVLAHDTLEKEFRFLAERLAQIVIKIRKETQVRGDRFQVSQVKPLPGKIADQVAGP